jgi:hypothetical protein
MHTADYALTLIPAPYPNFAPQPLRLDERSSSNTCFKYSDV